MRYVIISGISRGLGSCLLERFIERNYSVVVFGLNPNERLEKLAKAKGLSFHFHKTDFRNFENSDRVINEALRTNTFSSAEAVTLVNNAGTLSPVEGLFSIKEKDWREQLTVNLEIPIALSYAFCRRFREVSVPKRIVNISSRGALMPGAGLGMYCISKAGIDMLTKILHAENASERFPAKCVGVRPGAMKTEMQQTVRDSKTTPLETRKIFDKLAAEGLVRDPEEVSRAIMALVIDADIESGKTYELPGAGVIES